MYWYVCMFQTPDSGSAVRFTESTCSTHLLVVGLFAQVVDAVVVVLQQQVRHVLLVAELVVAQQAHCTATTGTLLFATPSACYDENVHFQAHYKPYHNTTPLHVHVHAISKGNKF